MSRIGFECDPQKVGTAKQGRCWPIRTRSCRSRPCNDQLYLTEDQRDGGFLSFYRDARVAGFKCRSIRDCFVVSAGIGQYIEWLAVPDLSQIPRRRAIRSRVIRRFCGGEGIAYHDGSVYFTTKRDNRVWCYEIESSELRVIYDIETSSDPVSGASTMLL